MEPQTQTNNVSRGKMGKVLTIALILIVLLLGFWLYQKMSMTSIADPINNSGNNMVPPGQSLSNLSDDERAALTFPSPNATQAELSQYTAVVTKVAVETDVLAIGKNCSASPVVLKTNLISGKKITINNTDSVAHRIAFNSSTAYDVVAGGRAEVSVASISGGKAGLYGYGCDNSSSGIGLIQVLP